MSTIYTQELADRMCEQLAEGISLRTVCLQEGMPSKATVFRWLRLYPEFEASYTRAKQESADALVEDMLDIADDRADDPQSRRVRVDTRKWIASKMKPKKYGEKLDVDANVNGKLELSGVVTFVEPDKKGDE